MILYGVIGLLAIGNLVLGFILFRMSSKIRFLKRRARWERKIDMLEKELEAEHNG